MYKTAGKIYNYIYALPFFVLCMEFNFAHSSSNSAEIARTTQKAEQA
jgi:riboflavin transporter FmnP